MLTVPTGAGSSEGSALQDTSKAVNKTSSAVHSTFLILNLLLKSIQYALDNIIVSPNSHHVNTFGIMIQFFNISEL